MKINVDEKKRSISFDFEDSKKGELESMRMLLAMAKAGVPEPASDEDIAFFEDEVKRLETEVAEEKVQVLNNELRRNFHEEYHWHGEKGRPLAMAVLQGRTFKTKVEVLAVKVPVRENYGIMVSPMDSNEVYEIGFKSLDYGNVGNIINKLPETKF
jgi:hypothetical protein